MTDQALELVFSEMAQTAGNMLQAYLDGDDLMARYHYAVLAMWQAKIDHWTESGEEKREAMAAAFDARFPLSSLVRSGGGRHGEGVTW